MSYPRPFVELMGDVVALVSSKVLAQVQAAWLEVMQEAYPALELTESSIQSISYVYGTYTEIQKVLAEKKMDPGTDGTGGKYDRWPMVALIMPFTEVKGATGGYYTEVQGVDMGIFFETELKWDTMQRYERVFKTILIPIYKALIESFGECGLFAVEDERAIKHQRIDLPFGSNGDGKDAKTSIFAETLDAIKIANLSLRVNNY